MILPTLRLYRIGEHLASDLSTFVMYVFNLPTLGEPDQGLHAWVNGEVWV